MIEYISTRNSSIKATASEAILQGQASDGGLFVPADLSALKTDYHRIIDNDFKGMAKAVWNIFFDDYGEDVIDELVELFDIRYNSTLGNASMGFGNFFMLNCEGGVEYRLPKWLFHAKMQLNALSLDMRPGFAYMDNFDQDISSPTANTFDQYHWYLAAATGVSTDVGAAYLLSNGNRLGVSYRWGYFTSRHTTSCPHSFEYAHHAILFHLGFALR